MVTLGEALPMQIARISAKRERWISYAKEAGKHGQGMQLTIAVMQAEINEAIASIASGDIARMLSAHQALKDYSDDD